MTDIHFAVVGGFLGAGKTTLLGAAARRLTSQGKRVGFITNDQSKNLDDTQLLKDDGLGVAEVGGGCFCCRFDQLAEAMDRLADELKPDVLFTRFPELITCEKGDCKKMRDNAVS